jgi:hypothetical protein
VTTGGTPATGGAGTTTGGGSSELFNNGTFIMGIQGPDPDALDTWAKRGMNAVVGPGAPGDGSAGSMTAYVAAIRSYNTTAGSTVFHMMHSPQSGETAGGDIWAWEQTAPPGNDEPDASSGLASNLPMLTSNYTTWKAQQPNMTVWLNFSGTDYIAGTSASVRANYDAAIAVGDWVSLDVYPWSVFNNWLQVNGVSMQGSASIIGYGLDKLRAQTSKPLLAYVQSGPTTNSDPTLEPIDIRNQMWNAVIHGARGILVWTANTSNNYKDDTLPQNATEIGANSDWINSLSAILTDQIISPVTLGPPDAIGVGTIHVGGRSTTSGKYYIVQNMSKTSSWTGDIPLAGVGTATDATVYKMPANWPTSINVTSQSCTACITNGAIGKQTLTTGEVRVFQVG